MSDCGICLSGPEDGCIEVLEDGNVAGRKPHRCCECRHLMPIGEVHERVKGVWEGEIATYRTCLICKEIRTAYACNGFSYGALWEEMNDYLFAEMNESCFDRLTTTVAKKYLRERWMKWKGLIK